MSMTNESIAQQLQKHATELDSRGENLFRARAYRGAAFSIRRLTRPLSEILSSGGRQALEQIPGIGLSLAYTIERLLTTGDFAVLSEDTTPDNQLRSLPGVGVRLLEVLRDRLGISTTEQLQDAIQSGRLTQSIPARKLASIQAALHLRSDRQSNTAPPGNEPSVELLLRLDRKFRQQGERSCRCWDEGWSLQVSRADSALAHRLGTTNDWVLIRFERNGERSERTIVTEHRGDLRGCRVVRGRESECRRLERGRVEPAA